VIYVECILLVLLIVCAIVAPLARRGLSAVILYMTFGLILSVLWLVLESPDLAITEAALGAGVTGILFYVTLRKIKRTKDD